MTRDDFIICIKLYTPNLLRFSKRAAGNVIGAEDIVQECFETLWKNRSKVEIDSAKSYLFSVAHKKIIDTFRSNRKMQDFESTSEELFTIPDKTDIGQLVRLAIDQIPSLYRELLTLRDLEGYTYKEIESITGLSEARVKVTLFRARKQIKDKILQLEVS